TGLTVAPDQANGNPVGSLPDQPGTWDKIKPGCGHMLVMNTQLGIKIEQAASRGKDHGPTISGQRLIHWQFLFLRFWRRGSPCRAPSASAESRHFQIPAAMPCQRRALQLLTGGICRLLAVSRFST